MRHVQAVQVESIKRYSRCHHMLLACRGRSSPAYCSEHTSPIYLPPAARIVYFVWGGSFFFPGPLEPSLRVYLPKAGLLIAATLRARNRLRPLGSRHGRGPSLTSNPDPNPATLAPTWTQKAGPKRRARNAACAAFDLFLKLLRSYVDHDLRTLRTTAIFPPLTPNSKQNKTLENTESFLENSRA